LEHVRHPLQLQHDQLLFRALAAVAVSSAAFAQVTISGTADVAYVKSDATFGTFFSKDAAFKQNQNATSVIRFSATEDLGGGMSAQAYYEINPNLVSTTIGNSQNFVGLSGSFGTVRMGKPNTGLLSTQAARTPYGTAIGSDYGLLSLAMTRANGAFQYRSPAIQGFTVVVDYLPKGSVTALAQATSLALTLGNVAAVPTNDKNATIVTVAGDVAGAKLAFSSSSNVYGGVKSQNDFSAQYAIDALTVYYGYSKVKGGDAVNNIAAKYTMGAIDLTVNYARLGGDDKVNSTTVGAAYNLSKRTIAYVKHNNLDSEIKTTVVGLQHNF
jgi:predicted porin